MNSRLKWNNGELDHSDFITAGYFNSRWSDEEGKYSCGWECARLKHRRYLEFYFVDLKCFAMTAFQSLDRTPLYLRSTPCPGEKMRRYFVNFLLCNETPVGI